MKGNILITIALIITSSIQFSCNHSHVTPISNRLTSFVDPTVVNLTPEFYKISNPTGNTLRDAIRVLEKDSRTRGKFQSLTLLERTMEKNMASFQFSGKTKVISDYTDAAIDEVITIQIEDNQEGPFYQLSFGSNP